MKIYLYGLKTNLEAGTYHFRTETLKRQKNTFRQKGVGESGEGITNQPTSIPPKMLPTKKTTKIDINKITTTETNNIIDKYINDESFLMNYFQSAFDGMQGTIAKILKNDTKSIIDHNKLKDNKLIAKYLTSNGKKDIKKQLYILLESYFITHSLDKLKESLKNFKNDTQLEIKELGLPNLQYEKIVIFGFVRNETKYEQGTTDTLYFLDNLAKPVKSGGTNPLYTQPFTTTNLPQQTDNNTFVPQITVLPSTTTTSTDVPQVNPLVAYPVKPVRNEVVYFAQQMGFIYVLKFMRWGFHYKQSKRDFANENERNTVRYNNILIDYIVTMMVAIGIYATNNHTLFYAILLDAILSILMYLRTKDDEILLVPYFLVFYGIDYLK